VTVHFTDIGGKTKIAMTMTLPDAEAARATREFIKQAGGNATWDRLAEYLAKETSNKELFVINRSFAVSRAAMFDMWTKPEHFSQWLPPTGFTMEFVKVDIRPGGTGFFRMTNGSSVTMYGRLQYLAIDRPERIVYTQQFCDEHENISRHPLAPVWPETMLTTVTLAEEGPEQTRVTVQWEPHGNVTPQELEAFRAERAGMTQGWTGSFDKLDAYLE